ncbi:hypothetical protein V1264_017248 [Littorina saxatilis]|uniref:Uncharacterized protein n=1 Tax=Littorina saxatilis TaxID=31220 RepID=A0AAN9BIU4_9CAEN
MRLVLFCLAVLSSNCAVVHGTGVAVNMTCPSRLVEEEVNSVTCIINTTEILNTRCVSPPSNVVFEIKGQVYPLCTSLYTSSCSTSPDLIDEGSCGCTEQTGDVQIYLFKFKGNAKDYRGTKLECTVCASIPEIKIPPTNCDSLKYGTGVAVNMTCPSRLVEEEVNSVTCRINTTEILNTRCVSPPSNVLFQVKGQVHPLCTSLYTSSCNVSPDLIDEGSCGCTEQTGDVKIYLFKFKGKAKDYNRTKLECTVCASIPRIKIPSTNCDSLEYGPKDVALAASSVDFKPT